MGLLDKFKRKKFPEDKSLDKLTSEEYKKLMELRASNRNKRTPAEIEYYKKLELDPNYKPPLNIHSKEYKIKMETEQRELEKKEAEEKAREVFRHGWTVIEKDQVRERQDGKCNRCKRSPERWEYHHLDGNRSNNSLSNCEALCPNCHSVKTHG